MSDDMFQRRAATGAEIFQALGMPAVAASLRAIETTPVAVHPLVEVALNGISDPDAKEAVRGYGVAAATFQDSMRRDPNMGAQEFESLQARVGSALTTVDRFDHVPGVQEALMIIFAIDLDEGAHRP